MQEGKHAIGAQQIGIHAFDGLAAHGEIGEGQMPGGGGDSEVGEISRRMDIQRERPGELDQGQRPGGVGAGQEWPHAGNGEGALQGEPEIFGDSAELAVQGEPGIGLREFKV